MKKVLLLAAVVPLLTGCFQSQIVSPGRKNILLATQRDRCTELDSRKVYSLFGLGAVPFNDATTIPSLKGVRSNEKVRFTTRISFLNYVISYLTLGIVGVHTIKTEVCEGPKSVPDATLDQRQQEERSYSDTPIRTKKRPARPATEEEEGD